ncbi:MAG: hypothetical protein K9N21_02740 [Deltaproteobacteria bacterium]|nr:hypothetical protein [Deltaproteobacteria bacterium]
MDKVELEERIKVLEAAYAKRAKPDPEAEARKQQEAEDERNVKDMLALADGTDEERRDVWRGHEAAKLSPQDAKSAFKQDLEDEAWASDMAGHARTRGGR